MTSSDNPSEKCLQEDNIIMSVCTTEGEMQELKCNLVKECVTELLNIVLLCSYSYTCIHVFYNIMYKNIQ